MCIYIYIYTHTYIHTYIHTCMHARIVVVCCAEQDYDVHMFCCKKMITIYKYAPRWIVPFVFTTTHEHTRNMNQVSEGNPLRGILSRKHINITNILSYPRRRIV